MERMTIVLILVALALAAFTGWVDVHNTDVQPAVACVLGFSLALSLVRPRLWWLWTLMIGLSIPVTHIIVRASGLHLNYTVDSFAGTFIALIPACLGAAAGFIVRLVISGMTAHHTPARG